MLKHLFTGIDGVTYDIGRVGGALSFLVGLGLEVYSVVWHVPFDFLAYGAGIAAMAAGIGALLKLKESQEPRP
jgi:hypothetical protein